MPCCYDWDLPEYSFESIQNGSKLEKFIHSLFFNVDDEEKQLGWKNCMDRFTSFGRQLVSLNFRKEINFVNNIGKIRMILGCKGKEINIQDEIGYLIRKTKYLATLEVDSVVGSNNATTLRVEDGEILEGLISSVVVNSNDEKARVVKTNTSPLKQNVEFIRNHVICSVFEFIETKELIESCSFVCKTWHELILYDKNCTEQIFGNRFNILSLQFDLDLDFELVRESYTNLNWMCIYMLSGMFHLEINPDYSNWLTTREQSPQFLTLLFVNPLVFLNLPSNHYLVERFSSHYKRILILSAPFPSLALIQRYKSRRYADVVLNNSNAKNLLQNVLLSPVIFPVHGSIFSIDFVNGIPSYLNFLKEITLEISPYVEKNHSGKIATFLDKMMEKANYFLQEFSNNVNYKVGKDILIGLHLIFLDRYYLGDNILLAPNLNFGKLLKNFNNNQGLLFETNPEKNFSSDILADLVKYLKEHDNQSNDQTYEPSPNSPFKHPLNAFEFFQEHIFELSSINEPIPQLIDQHLQLLQKDNISFPNKSSDLILHFHLLHPQHYIQDCARLLPNNSIKFHDFNFLYHHNLNINLDSYII